MASCHICATTAAQTTSRAGVRGQAGIASDLTERTKVLVSERGRGFFPTFPLPQVRRGEGASGCPPAFESVGASDEESPVGEVCVGLWSCPFITGIGTVPDVPLGYFELRSILPWKGDVSLAVQRRGRRGQPWLPCGFCQVL